MKVTYYQPCEFELTKKDKQQAARLILNELIYPAEYLRNINGEMWLTQDDPHWRHGSVSEEKVRKATELDLAVFKVLEAIK